MTIDALFDGPEGGVIAFGAAEYLYLLAAYGDAGANRSVIASGIDGSLVNDRVRMSGASSLVARGWLESPDGETLVPVREAAAIALAASRAELWVRGALLADGGDALGTFVITRALDLELLAVGGPAGSWAVGAVDGDIGAAGAVAELLDDHLAAVPDGAVFLNVERADATPSATAFFRRAPSGSGFEVARGTGTDVAPTVQPHALDASELEALLLALIGEVDA